MTEGRIDTERRLHSAKRRSTRGAASVRAGVALMCLPALRQAALSTAVQVETHWMSASIIPSELEALRSSRYEVHILPHLISEEEAEGFCLASQEQNNAALLLTASPTRVQEHRACHDLRQRSWIMRTDQSPIQKL
ncbi:hypothetical protein JOQ06_024971 [Pogonophryne albipinna]|uniref:Uncharacterized protein n=1 Tax=Pogonophryne albipinna TaxID=1090488 RepID=A0AAD6AUU0_9TELE|nr:hypothetical protein JOQ06_024971 [Pogonophryne albipinna]